MGRIERGAAAAIALMLTVSALVSLSAPTAAAAGPTIYGAGSTWSQIAVDQWRADVARQGLSVNYTGVGSSKGREFYIQDAVDFAVSEIPFEPSEKAALRRAYQYLPIVAGGTSMMYNLRDATGRQVRDLKLSSSTIAKIFTGKITNWSHPDIRRDYGKPLPNREITLVVRSDGSGTSAQFSAYLHSEERGIWCSFYRACRYTSYWPECDNCISQNGSDGVSNYVANPSLGQGAITYVEYGYAKERGFPVVSVRNKSGNYAQPTANNVAVALDHARLNKDRTQNLSGVYDAPESNAYPISSYSYMIIPKTNIDTAKGEVLGRFIIYFACTGQRSAAALGYSPLPPTLVGFVFDAVRALKGAPNPPALNGQACPNPTLTGDFKKDAGSTEGVISGTGTGTGDTTGSASGEGAAQDAGTAGPTAAGTAIASLSPVATLPPDELAKMQRAAAEEINGSSTSSGAMLTIVGLLILFLLFAPLFLRLRNKGSAGGSG